MSPFPGGPGGSAGPARELEPDPKRVRALFLAALERGPDERAAFVAAAGEAEEVRREVASLLAHHAAAGGEAAGGFLERGAWPAAASSAPSAPERPERIGPYRVLALLGEGGMGVVYVAEEEHPRREVALKVLRAGLATPRDVRRFEHEAEILARLQHPAIAHLYGVGTERTAGGERPYLAMELVRGTPLREHARNLGVRDKVQLLVRICAGVQHAHERGVVHRDLKPGNVLVEPSGLPKILDFGIARLVVADPLLSTAHTATGQLLGTLPYMSPEQVAGERGAAAAVDARSDVYALGVLAYELLAGRLPLELGSLSLAEAARVLVTEDPLPLGAVARGLPADLVTVVSKALEKERGRRYASAAELAGDLERFLADEPILARPPSAIYRLRKLARRHRALVLGLAAVILALGGGLLATLWQARTARAEARQAQEMNRFLVDMLGAPQPEALGADVPLREALDWAAEHAATRFADLPAVHVAVGTAIGKTYLGLGVHAEAERELEAARALASSTLGPDHPSTLTALLHLGTLRRAQDRLEESEELLQEVLERASRARGEHDPLVVSATLSLVLVVGERGRLEESEELGRRAVALADEALGAESEEALAARTNLSNALYRRGRLEEALALCEEVLAVRSRLEGPSGQGTLTERHNLATLRVDLGDLPGAEREIRAVLEQRRRRNGPGHPQTLLSANLLTVILRRMDRIPEAIELGRENHALLTAALGEDHDITLLAANSLASTLRDARQFEEAAALLQRALDLRLAKGQDSDLDTLTLLLNLGTVWLERGRPDLAEPLIARCLDGRLTLLGSDHALTHGTRFVLGRVLAAQGEEAAAEAELLAAHEGIAQLAESERLGLSYEVAQELVKLYERRGDAAEAARWRERLAAEKQFSP